MCKAGWERTYIRQMDTRQHDESDEVKSAEGVGQMQRWGMSVLLTGILPSLVTKGPRNRTAQFLREPTTRQMQVRPGVRGGPLDFYTHTTWSVDEVYELYRRQNNAPYR